MKQDAKVLVVGGGYLSRQLTRHFLEHTDWNVTAFVHEDSEHNFEEDKRLRLLLVDPANPYVDHRSCMNWSKLLGNIASGDYFDVVVDVSGQDMFHSFEQAASSIKNVSDLVSRKTSVFVHVSTREVYGADCREQAVIDPGTFFGAVMAAQECFLSWKRKSDKFPVLTLRIGDVYGKEQSLESNLADLIMKLRRNDAIMLKGCPVATETVFPLYVDNFCEAVTHAIDTVRVTTLVDGQAVFNLSDEVSMSKTAFVNWLADLLKVTPKIVFAPAENFTEQSVLPSTFGPTFGWYQRHASGIAMKETVEDTVQRSEASR